MLSFIKKYFSSWGKNEKGTTAIEFSLMAIPYIFLTVSIIELSVMYASASLLEGATGSAARQIRTGQIQESGANPETAFRQAICDYATVLISCNDVVVESVPLASFDNYESAAPQYDEDGNIVSQGFTSPGSNDRVLIRVSYRYNMMTPLIGPLLAGSDNSRLFVSTIVLQTEPYQFEEGDDA